jgi:hypothetical protein
MDAWQIVLLIVVILLVLALIGWALSRRQVSAKKEAQAREHLTEARERQARAESARAAADEKAAQLRRERAELDQRAAQQEREAAQLAQDADRDQTRAAELQQRAHKLAPHLADQDTRTAPDSTPASGYDGYADTRGFDAHRDGIDEGTMVGRRPDGSDQHGTSHEYAAEHRADDHRADDQAAHDGTADNRADDGTGQDREPATAYRHSAPVTDPDATTEDAAADGTYRNPGDQTVTERRTVVDRDGDGYTDRTVREETYADEASTDRAGADGASADGATTPDREQRGGSGLNRLKDRLTGRSD